jgi:hypothetical protein
MMNRHDFDPFSFVFGIGFFTVGLRLVLSDGSLFDQAWLWPVFMIFSGAVFMAAAAKRTATRGLERTTGADQEP